MTNAEALKMAISWLKEADPVCMGIDTSAWKDMADKLESLANKYSQYEELYSIFQKAQESLEDAKDRLVEP